MTYRVELDRRARKGLDLLRGPAYVRAREALRALAEDPRPEGSVKLRGSPNAYRIRVGVYRIVYVIDDDLKSVTVLAVQHRKDVYRE